MDQGEGRDNRKKTETSLRTMKGKGRVLKNTKDRNKMKPLDKQMEIITKQAFEDKGMGRTHKASLEESSAGSSY